MIDDAKPEMKRADRTSRWLRLAGCVFAICIVWGWALPSIARWKPVRDHIAVMEARDVYVGAMFYTELNWEPPSFFLDASAHPQPAKVINDAE